MTKSETLFRETLRKAADANPKGWREEAKAVGVNHNWLWRAANGKEGSEYSPGVKDAFWKLLEAYDLELAPKEGGRGQGVLAEIDRLVAQVVGNDLYGRRIQMAVRALVKESV